MDIAAGSKRAMGATSAQGTSKRAQNTSLRITGNNSTFMMALCIRARLSARVQQQRNDRNSFQSNSSIIATTAIQKEAMQAQLPTAFNPYTYVSSRVAIAGVRPHTAQSSRLPRSFITRNVHSSPSYTNSLSVRESESERERKGELALLPGTTKQSRRAEVLPQHTQQNSTLLYQ